MCQDGGAEFIRASMEKGVRMKTLWRWLVIGWLSVLTAGCIPAALPTDAPHGESGSGYDVVDDQGTVVHLPHKPRRIMTAHFHLDCMLLGIVREERVVSVTATLDRPDVSYAAPEEFSKPQRNASPFPSMEYIAALQPDLIFVRSSFGEDKIQSCRDMGIPVYVSEIPRDFDELKAKIRGIAAATDEVAVGETLIEKITGFMEETWQAIPEEVAYQKSCVLVSKMNHAYGGKGCFFDEMCRLAKVRNAVADMGIWNGQEISKEIVVKANPDYLLTEGGGSYGDAVAAAQELLEDPAFETLSAVKEGHVRGVRSRYLYNSNQNCIYAIRHLTNILYGNILPEIPEIFLKGY